MHLGDLPLVPSRLQLHRTRVLVEAALPRRGEHVLAADGCSACLRVRL